MVYDRSSEHPLCLTRATPLAGRGGPARVDLGGPGAATASSLHAGTRRGPNPLSDLYDGLRGDRRGRGGRDKLHSLVAVSGQQSSPRSFGVVSGSLFFLSACAPALTGPLEQVRGRQPWLLR